jgi:predicted SAM-dependent methyltransferase
VIMTHKMNQCVQDSVLKHKSLQYVAMALLVGAVNFPLGRLWYAARLRYLIARAAPGQVWLHLACGKRPFFEWINIDVVPSSPGPQVLLDLRKPFPLPDNTVDLIYSEDFMEHLELPQGRRMLRECYRVLRGGGMMRILTPNLRVLATRYVERSPELLEWYNRNYGTTSFAEILNHGMRSWGHRFIYDDGMLTRELRAVGFSAQSQSHNRSSNPALCGLDRGDVREAEYRMYFDCTKPLA